MRWFAVVSFVGALLLARPVLACGGGFGFELEIEPSQTVVLSHADGVESYLFNPHFCGPAADFGLIVPIPGPLTGDPSEEGHVEEWLAELAAPEMMTIVEDCSGDGVDGGAVAGGAGVGGDRMGGVDVIDSGSVGIFDWAQLSADDASAFTDWLDDNAFPYEAEAMAVFEHYVDAGWQFLAFTVRPGEGSGSEDRICGDFGPLRIDFEADMPVVPARIASADADSLGQEFIWQVYAITDARVRVAGVDELSTGEGMSAGGGGATGASGGDTGLTHSSQELRFAGELSAGDLTPGDSVDTDSDWLSEVASEGDWLTELRVTFGGAALDDDLLLEPHPDQEAFRRVEIDYVCEGEGQGGGPSGSAGSSSADESSSRDGGGGGGGGCTVVAAGPGTTPPVWGVLAVAWLRFRRRRTARR